MAQTEVSPEIEAALRQAFTLFDRDVSGDAGIKVEEVQGLLKNVLKTDVEAPMVQAMLQYVMQEEKEGPRKAPAQLSVDVGEGVRRSHLSPEKVVEVYDNLRTPYELFQRSIERYGDRPFLGTRTEEKGYVWQTYKEVAARVTAVGSGLRAKCELAPNSMVGINMNTRAEWTITREAAHAYGLVVVTLYDALDASSTEYIVNETQLTTIVTTAGKLANLTALKPKVPSLKYIIVVGGATPEQISAATEAGYVVSSFEDLEAFGASNQLPHTPPQPSDLALICYTSGTTGAPKGVMHRQSAMAVTVLASINEDSTNVNENDVHFAFLPLAHIMELYLETAFTTVGSAIGYYRGDLLKLMEDIAEVKPTVFITVPRIINRLYTKISAGFAQQTGVPKLLLHLAMESKKKRLQEKGWVRSLWDFVAFKTVRAVLGGRVRLITTGSAPIAPEVLSFLRIVFGATVTEGYGMSEVLVTNQTHMHDLNPGTIGAPAPHVEQKLVDIPEMNYLTTQDPPRGELCFRGPTVMVGYFKQEALTKEAIDEDGWMHSGDVAQLEPNGAFRIIDRKKNIFKLAQGEYVAPEKIENVYARARFVAQSFVHGNSIESCLVAIVVPDFESLVPFATAQGITGTPAELCTNPAIVELITKEIQTAARAGGLVGYEIVRAITLTPEPFTVENGLTTPTFKLVRRKALEKYGKVCEEMYAKLRAESA